MTGTPGRGWSFQGGRGALGLIGIAALVMLGGCAANPAVSHPTIASAPPASRTAPAPILDAVTVTHLAMVVFTDHDPSLANWISNLAPYLSQQAISDWNGTDPTLVPANVVVGPAAVVSTTDYLATTTQDTDAGTYTLVLSRMDDGGWQVERITPPEHGPVA